MDLSCQHETLFYNVPVKPVFIVSVDLINSIKIIFWWFVFCNKLNPWIEKNSVSRGDIEAFFLGRNIVDRLEEDFKILLSSLLYFQATIIIFYIITLCRLPHYFLRENIKTS